MSILNANNLDMIVMDNMKSSRRKQTKPIRVPFGVDPDTGAFNATLIASQFSPARIEIDRNHNRGTGVDESDVPLDMHVNVMSCGMCPETFLSKDELFEHMEISHSPPLKKQRVNESEFFPTAYHRLGSELYQENTFLSNGHSETQSEALSLTKPKLSPEAKDPVIMRDQNGESSRKVDGGKIFHPDAYCELCDREFCNKYFLKTHKANKHGIFENNSPTPYSGGPAAVIPLPSDAPMPFDANLPRPTSDKTQVSPVAQNQQTSNSRKEVTDKPEMPLSSPASKTKSEAELATEKKVSSLISAVMSSVANSSNHSASGAENSSKSSGSSAGSAPKDPTMEDYCEICQKHFCNKYYLKKHKQDVHGIIPETGPTTTKRSRASGSLLDLPSVSSVSMAPMLLPQPMVSMAGMPALPHGVMVLNPFLSQMTLIPTGNIPQPLLPGPQLHHSVQSSLISQPMPMPNLPGPSPTPPVSSSGPQSQASPIGAHNSDTYCSLCCKEFCNKYFLKIHNISKHGMPSDDLISENRLNDMIEPNGVIAPPNAHSVKEKLESHKNINLSSPPPLTSVSQMVTCKQCDKDLPNAHAYKLHQITEHGKSLEASMPDGFESSLPKCESSISNSGAEALFRMASDANMASAHAAQMMGSGHNGNNSGGTSMFGSMVAAKLADRVRCEICNKELCNKYFLKAHMQKMHGIDMIREDSSDKSQSPAAGNKSQILHSPGNKPHQPLNMTLGGHSPMGHIPKLDLRDFRDYPKEYPREYKFMKEFGSLRNFAEIPNYLTDTMNNEFFRRTQAPFKGLDFSHPGLPQGPVECPPPEELVKMGIDPEAYCEICKKEFCSKYFLRTHRQNIHGIKTDLPETDRRSRTGPKGAISKLTNNNNNSYISLPGNAISALNFGFGGLAGGAGACVGGNGNAAHITDGYEKHSWRWKEPVNSARVTCEICNKEVCNKYFLRVHLQNKHGIAPSDKSLSPTNGGSPIPSDMDTSSNASSQPDNFLIDKNGQMMRPDVSQIIPLPPSDRSGKSNDSSKMKFEDDKSQSSAKHNNSSGSYPTCHLCERQFKNTQWLTAHLMKDHAELGVPEALDMRTLPTLNATVQFTMPPDRKLCHVCNLTFPNDLTLQLHMIQEHNAQVMLEMDEDMKQSQAAASEARDNKMSLFAARRLRQRRFGPRKNSLFISRRQKVYVCSACDYETFWHCNLQSHEQIMHGSPSKHDEPQASQYLCKITARKESEDGLDSASLNSGSYRSPVSTSTSRRFRCALCKTPFVTPSQCQLHIKNVHVHLLKDFASCTRSSRKFACDVCTFSTRYPNRYRSHMTYYHHRLSGFDTQNFNGCHLNRNKQWVESFGERGIMEGGSVVGRVEASARSECATDDLLQQTFHMDVSTYSTSSPVSSNTFVSAVAAMPVRRKIHEPVSVSFLLTPITP